MLFALLLFYYSNIVVRVGTYPTMATCIEQGVKAGKDSGGSPTSYAYRCIPVGK